MPLVTVALKVEAGELLEPKSCQAEQQGEMVVSEQNKQQQLKTKWEG